MKIRIKLAVMAVATATLTLGGSTPHASADGYGTAVVAVPGSFAAGWATPVVAVQVGGILPMVSVDISPHNVCIVDGTIAHCGTQYESVGVTTDTPTGFLVAGNVYDFYCSVHAGAMRGTLVALPAA